MVVALSPGALEHLTALPFATVLLDWSEEVSEAGTPGEFDDEHREALYKALAPRIRDLMETLCGEQAD